MESPQAVYNFEKHLGKLKFRLWGDYSGQFTSLRITADNGLAG